MTEPAQLPKTTPTPTPAPAPTPTPTPTPAPTTATQVETRVIKEIPLRRTEYDASAFEVFGKHFLAGFGQALGMVMVYVIFLVISGFLMMKYLLPTVQPYLDLFKQSVNSIQSMQSAFGQVGGGLNMLPEQGTSTGLIDGGQVQGAVQGAGQGIQGTQMFNAGTSMTITPEQLKQAQDLLQQMQQR